MTQQGAVTKIIAQSLKTGDRRELLQGAFFPRYTPSGQLVYLQGVDERPAQGANLMAARSDSQRLAITGAAVPVIEGVLVEGGVAQYDFSSTGSLVYVPNSVQAAQFRLVWVYRKGVEQPVPAPAHNYVLPRVSPDGKRVAVNIEEEDSQIVSRPTGTIMAPPKPCRMRLATSTWMVLDMPQRNDPIVKMRWN